jgi:hypothetical protein
VVDGVFCVEGQWDRDLNDRGSVLPTLELLERIRSIRFIHKDVATPDELFYYLDRWLLSRYSDFHVCHFAMHGTTTGLWLTDRCTIELADVAERLADRCEGKQFYFGSCSVLRGSDTRIHDFLTATGATLVCGYSREVDWVESAAFETVLLEVLANGQKLNSVELRTGSARWAPLAAHLGFRIAYADGRTWRPEGGRRIPAQVVSAAAS